MGTIGHSGHHRMWCGKRVGGEEGRQQGDQSAGRAPVQACPFHLNTLRNANLESPNRPTLKRTHDLKGESCGHGSREDEQWLSRATWTLTQQAWSTARASEFFTDLGCDLGQPPSPHLYNEDIYPETGKRPCSLPF